MKGIDTKSMPAGFEAGMSPDGHPLVRYRTKGQGCGMLFIGGFCVVTFGFGLLMLMGMFSGGRVQWHAAAFCVPSLLFGLVLLGWWFLKFRADSAFIFYPESMVFERRLLSRTRRVEISRTSIKAVRRELGNETDDFVKGGLWDLVVEGHSETRLLTNQIGEKVAWLGGVVADWAGVDFQGLS